MKPLRRLSLHPFKIPGGEKSPGRMFTCKSVGQAAPAGLVRKNASLKNCYRCSGFAGTFLSFAKRGREHSFCMAVSPWIRGRA